MVLLWPLSLFGLLAVAAAAVWALFRPGRQLAVVGSLELWQKALDRLDRSARRRSRRVTLHWLCLLAGALALVLATSRPAYRTTGSARHVAIGVIPSAELAGEGGIDTLRHAAGAMLSRLDGHDQVQLLLPAVAGGASGWLSVGEARAELDSTKAIPAAVEELPLPPPSSLAQHTYYFAPAGTGIAPGPNVSIVELPPALPRVTIDAAGASELAAGRMQVFVAVRNQTPAPARIEIMQADVSADGKPGAAVVGQTADVPGLGRWGSTFERTAAAGLVIQLAADGKPLEGIGASAYLVRREIRRTRVAITGPDEPAVRRFIEVHPGMELVGAVEDADIVIANVVDPPADKPALVINPAHLPPGWTADREYGNVVLTVGDVAVDQPIMRGVDLSGVAIRRLAPWKPVESPPEKPLASYAGGAIILLQEAGGGPPGKSPARIFVAFDIGVGNTFFSMSPGFVVFLANAVNYLAPNTRMRTEYESLTPLAAAAGRDWKAVVGPAHDSGPGGLAWPGIYRDSAGALHAVSLTGLRGESAKVDPETAVAKLELPPPQCGPTQAEFWPFLVVLAAGLWMAGWALRAR
ncbi:MAG: BatA domain-containing protein [Phycisphaerae bacterium]